MCSRQRTLLPHLLLVLQVMLSRLVNSERYGTQSLKLQCKPSEMHKLHKAPLQLQQLPGRTSREEINLRTSTTSLPTLKTMIICNVGAFMIRIGFWVCNYSIIYPQARPNRILLIKQPPLGRTPEISVETPQGSPLGPY